LNRGCATLLAGALGVGGQHLATTFGEREKPIVLGILVFILGIYVNTILTKKMSFRMDLRLTFAS